MGLSIFVLGTVRDGNLTVTQSKVCHSHHVFNVGIYDQNL
jgi:hypothetical protein